MEELERRVKTPEAILAALSTSSTSPGCPSCRTDKMKLWAESTFGVGVMTRTCLRMRHFTFSLDNCRHELTILVLVQNAGVTALQDNPCNLAG